MRICQVDFPDDLISSLTEGNLVLFAGAGVSMGDPANFPSFEDLAKAIAAGTSRVPEKDEPLDRFLGKLNAAGIDVHNRAVEILATDPKPTELHLDLLRLFSGAGSDRIVTTNFDTLFEDAAIELGTGPLNAFAAPALPLGRALGGVVHVHGALGSPGGLVLTDDDFGRSYMVDGHTRRFLVELFQSFDVLFVGYSHDDTIMRYLARALPTGDPQSTASKKRFAMAPDGSDSDWRYLNIEPIFYPKPDKTHSELTKAVKKLAKIVSRGAFEWRERIYNIVRGKPTLLTEAEEGELAYALDDPFRTRFFIEFATDPDWIGWLDRQGYLDKLFASQGFEEREATLARWLAKHFAREKPPVLFEAIHRHGGKIGPVLWNSLAHALFYGPQGNLDDDDFRKWVSLLLATMPHPKEWQFVEPHLSLMAGRCVERGEFTMAVDVFDRSANSRPIPSPGFGYGGATFRPEVLGDHFHLSEIWTGHLKPHLDMVAESLLARMHGHLTKRYEEIQVWLRMSGGLDSDSTFRPTIEPDDSDTSEEAHDVIVDVARDCLDFLAEKEPTDAAPWFEIFIKSEAPLLRRIAIHSLPKRSDLTPNEKSTWMIEKSVLFGLAERHELHRAMTSIYPDTSPATRRKIIDAMLSHGDSETQGNDDG